MTFRRFPMNCIWVLLSLLLLGLLCFFAPKGENELLGLSEVFVTGDTSSSQEVIGHLSDYSCSLYYQDAPLPLDVDSGMYYLYKNPEKNTFDGVLTPVCDADVCSCELYRLEDPMWTDLETAISTGHTFYLLAYIYTEPDRVVSMRIPLTITTLPLLSISTKHTEQTNFDPSMADTDPDEYYFNNEDRCYGDITMFGACPGGYANAVLQTKLMYHTRGATTSNFDKKNYTLKLLNHSDEPSSQTLFGLGSSSKWKLCSLYSDRTKLRDKVSLDLWREIAEYASETSGIAERGADMAYCELILDGEYRGLYGILYPIDEHTLSLSQKDTLLKVIGEKAPSYNAFMYSYDNDYKVASTIRLRYPQDLTSYKEAWQPTFSFLMHGFWTPNADTLAELLELENVADFVLFNQAIAGMDNAFKNTYLVSRHQQNDTYVSTILPWDLNYTFGDVYDYEGENYTRFDEDATYDYICDAFSLLFTENEKAGDILAKKKAALLAEDGILSEKHIMDTFEKEQQILFASGVLKREQETWRGCKLQTDLSPINTFVQNRISYVRNL